MFERKKHAPPQKRIDCLIGAGTTVKGDVTFTGGLRVDGVVQGNVDARPTARPGTLVVSEQARVDGEIKVSHVVVNGTVNGPITADDFLELQAKAKIVGRHRVPDARDAPGRGRPGTAPPRRTWHRERGRIEERAAAE